MRQRLGVRRAAWAYRRVRRGLARQGGGRTSASPPCRPVCLQHFTVKINGRSTRQTEKREEKKKPQTAPHGLPRWVWAKALARVTRCCFSREAAGAKFAFTTNRDNTMS